MSDKKDAGMVLAGIAVVIIWLASALASLGLTIAIIWAIVKVVSHFVS